MNPEKAVIILPEEIKKGMQITNEDTLVLKVTETGASLRKSRSEGKDIPYKSLGVIALISLVSFFAVFYKYHQIPLTGQLSTATLVIIIGGLTGMISFTRAFIKNKNSKEKHLSQAIYWRNFPTVFLSFTVLLGLSLLMLFRVLGDVFAGATFDIYTSTAIGVIFTVIINYMMISMARSLTPARLIQSLIAIILGGATIAVLTNKDQQWWLHNFSFLGTPEASNAWQFNLTLMLSALLMVALIDYLFVLLYEQLGKTKNLVVFKILLITTAICLGGVGFFPYNESTFSQQMHNRSAGYLVYLFIIMIAALRWLMPTISKQFLRLSYMIAAGLVLSVFLFQGVHYLSLTAFELIAFVLAFTWILMLLNIIVNTVMNTGQQIEIDVE